MCLKSEPLFEVHNGMMHQDIELNRPKSNMFEAISKLQEHKETCFKCKQCEENL